jgi:tetratricopeptide (TPR) repeat protein
LQVLSALDVDARSNAKSTWAMCQKNLGLALFEQSYTTTSDSEAIELLTQAAKAERDALGVYSKPLQDWAEAQDSLGLILRAQGERSSGPEAVRLIMQATEAHRAVLPVYCGDGRSKIKDGMQGNCAITLFNLGLAQAARQDWTGAATSYRRSIGLYPIEDAKKALEGIYHDHPGLAPATPQGQKASGKKRHLLYESALECLPP